MHNFPESVIIVYVPVDIKVSLKTHERYLLNIALQLPMAGVVLVVVPCHGIVGCSNAHAMAETRACKQLCELSEWSDRHK